jgi:putative spermidine/putrescine transport system permease protein
MRPLRLMLLAPPLLLVAAFVLLPILIALYASLRQDGQWSLVHYLAFLQRGQYLAALVNTALFAGSAASASVLLALPACAYLSWRQGRLLRLFGASLLLALAISGLLRILSWQILLSRSGPLNAALLSLGWLDQPMNLLYSRLAVLLGMTQIMLPLAALILLAGLRDLDASLALAARTLGAGFWQVARDIWWPQLRRPLANALLAVFALSSGFFFLPALLGGPGDTVLGKLMHDDLVYDFEQGAALAAVSGIAMTLLVLLVTLSCLLLGGRPFQRRSRP